MVVFDRGTKTIYTDGINLGWLPYIIKSKTQYFFRFRNHKIIKVKTLNDYKEIVKQHGFELVDLATVSEEYGLEIFEVSRNAVIINNVLVENQKEKKFPLSFVGISIAFGLCNDKFEYTYLKNRYKKLHNKKEVADIEFFLHLKNNKKISSQYKKRDTSISKVLEENGLDYFTYKDRLRRGWDKEKAMTLPKQPAHKSTCKASYDHEGRFFESVDAMIKFHGVSKHTFYKRKRQGKSIKECLVKKAFKHSKQIDKIEKM